jgi:hypothetical protein
MGESERFAAVGAALQFSPGDDATGPLAMAEIREAAAKN